VFRAIADHFVEAATRLTASPLRSLGVALPTALGVGLLVATVIAGQGAASQVTADFDALRSTEVRLVASRGASVFGDSYTTILRQYDFVRRFELLRDLGDHSVRSDPDSNLPVRSSAFACNEAGPTALKLTIDGGPLAPPQTAGWVPALVGRRLAKDLGIGVADGMQTVWIDEVPAIVVGIIADSPLESRLLDSVLILSSDAEGWGMPESTATLILEVAPGSGQLAADVLPLALHPQAPSDIVAVAPPDPGDFRRRIEASVKTGLQVLGVIALAVGALTVAVAGWAAVSLRTAEIGLLRAIGARPRDVFIGLMTESLLLGVVGGTLGVSLGTIAAIGVAFAQNWSVTLDPVVLLDGFVIAIPISMVGGIVPAIRAVRTDPVNALRSA